MSKLRNINERTELLFCANGVHLEPVYKNVTAKVGRLDVIIPLCKICYDLAFNVCPNCGEIHSGLSCAYISDDELKEKGYDANELLYTNENFDDLGDEPKKKDNDGDITVRDSIKGAGALLMLLAFLLILKSFL